MTDTFEIEVPLHRGKPPLTLNQRLHYHDKGKRTATVRSSVNLAMRHQRPRHIGPVDHVTVQLHYATGDHRRRDTDNLVPTMKPAVDGLVDAGLVVDDDPTHITTIMPVIHHGPGKRRLWLTVHITKEAAA